MPTAAELRAALDNLFRQAEQAGQERLIVNSGELHRMVGAQNRLPMSCGALRRAMKAGDQILRQPPKGQGATLDVLYLLPRNDQASQRTVPETLIPPAQIQPVNAFVLQRQPTQSWATFIDYWAKAYNYLESNSAYDEYVINRTPSFIFDSNNLRELFAWKNKTGDKLTAKKEGTVTDLIDSLPKINQLRQQWNSEAFQNEFGSISGVWQTFLMHIIQPDRFPIFDQHVYRAYSYLQTGQSDELNHLTTIKRKMAVYEQYQSFFDAIRQKSGSTPRTIDKALWAFGRFIKQYPALVR